MIMENVIHLSIFLFLVCLPLLVSSTETKVHIVYFGEHSGEKTMQEIEEIHHSYLLSVKETEEDAKSSLLYSYKHINGFAAFLTPYEASKLSELEEVASVFPSNPQRYSLQTTRSWDFIGLLEKRNLNNSDKEDDLLSKCKYGKNVIIGVIDSGVWPESQSFNDEGMDQIPKLWNGTCQSGDAFNSSHCNKKIIGARYYIKGFEAHHGPLNQTLDYRSPRDKGGHGTHTSSTVAGRRVKNVSALGGFAWGTASGGAPLAQLAIYKVCWVIEGEESTCTDEDILAAIDAAIADGVHVLSISLGTDTPIPYDEDVQAIGALHAVKKNIVVACSAGNKGPDPATVLNVAPWIITVGASSIDRIFPSTAVLGNGINIMGQTITPSKMKNRLYPLVFAGQLVNASVPKNSSAQCLRGSLSPEKANGKIVLCLRGEGDRVAKGMEVQRAGGIGLILGNNEALGNELTTDAHVLPATAVNYTDAVKIQKYIESANEPKAYIRPATTVLYAKPAPIMVAYSSRGPNAISPNILKPDITAPGLNILAAWSEASSPTGEPGDKRVVDYNIESGTSMACPHIAAVSALLKVVHPDWSSAAIRSALMTSAGQIDNEGNPITDTSGGPADPFQFGSGHLRPTKALDPGLIYDASYEDYLLFLCSTGVNNLTGSFKCPENPPSPANLNYPSVAIPELSGTVTVVRTVTNVGSCGQSVYVVDIKPPQGFSVNISPHRLYFNRTDQKISFNITVTADIKFKGKIEKGKYSFGCYTWSDRVHTVRSPMAVSHA